VYNVNSKGNSLGSFSPEANHTASRAETITDFIRRDLKRRIQTDGALPAQLTLTELARHYHVSVTPVRQAVRALLMEQVLLKHSNGRLQVNPARDSCEASLECMPAQPARSEDWEAVLTEEVIRQSLRGDGRYLREEAMAQHYGIGRTVLRQVFHRLAGKGLLMHVPRRGWHVRTFDAEDMRAYLVAREALEGTALELARPHLVTADLERMLAGNAPEASNGAARLDNALHRYFIEKSGNRYIQDFFDRHGLYYTTLFDFAAPEARALSEMAAQHREILAALLAGDWPRAREALAHHIRAQQPIVRRLMEQAARGALQTS
jgi:DNA-binding GntR family transcriptional regulator